MLGSATIIQTTVTIIFFCIEAILHYNIGKTGNITSFHFPTMKDSLKLISTITIFAIASTLTANYIETLLVSD